MVMWSQPTLCWYNLMQYEFRSSWLLGNWSIGIRLYNIEWIAQSGEMWRPLPHVPVEVDLVPQEQMNETWDVLLGAVGICKTNVIECLEFGWGGKTEWVKMAKENYNYTEINRIMKRQFTSWLEVFCKYSKALCPWEEVVLEDWQTFLLGIFTSFLILLCSEPGTLTEYTYLCYAVGCVCVCVCVCVCCLLYTSDAADE